MGAWEDYFAKVVVKGKPAAIRRFAMDLHVTGENIVKFGEEAKDLAANTDGGAGEGKGWQGPAGRAYRSFAKTQVTQPLDDRGVKIGPVVNALNKAAEALTEAQGKMPRPKITGAIGTLQGDDDGNIGGYGDYQQLAQAAYDRGGAHSTMTLTWTQPTAGEGGAASFVIPADTPKPEAAQIIAVWYGSGAALAGSVHDELNGKYTKLAKDMKIDAYGDDGKKKTGDGPPGGGDPGGKTPGSDPTDKNDPTKDPDKKPDQDPDGKRPDQNPEDKGEQDPDQNQDGQDQQDPDDQQQPPGTGEDPEKPGTDPGTDPYEPDPYNPDPYNPDPYEPPDTGLAGAGDGGFGGGGLGGASSVGTAAAGTGLSPGTAGTAGPATMGAGAGGGANGFAGGMAPMGGHGGGHGGGREDLDTWLTEDEDPWSSDQNTAPPVVGR